MHLAVKKYELLLKRNFQLSYGSYDRRTTFILELNHNNFRGYGEAVSIDYYGWTEEKIINGYKTIEELIEKNNKKYTLWEIKELIRNNDKILSPVRSAFDCAAWDIKSKVNKVTLRREINPQLNIEQALPPSSYTISGSEIDEVEQQIRDSSWPVLKIKMGTDHDIKIAEILSHFPEKKFRIDANAGWTTERASLILNLLNKDQIEFIEQPFPSSDHSSYKWMRKESDFNIMADESCQGIDDVGSCAGYFDAINIKLMKCGGISTALEMIAKARSLSLEIMIGCMTETSLGISAAAQLLHLVDYADLDGACLIQNDPAEGVEIIDGRVLLNDQYGIGAILTGI